MGSFICPVVRPPRPQVCHPICEEISLCVAIAILLEKLDMPVSRNLTLFKK